LKQHFIRRFLEQEIFTDWDFLKMGSK